MKKFQLKCHLKKKKKKKIYFYLSHTTKGKPHNFYLIKNFNQ